MALDSGAVGLIKLLRNTFPCMNIVFPWGFRVHFMRMLNLITCCFSKYAYTAETLARQLQLRFQIASHKISKS